MKRHDWIDEITRLPFAVAVDKIGAFVEQGGLGKERYGPTTSPMAREILRLAGRVNELEAANAELQAMADRWRRRAEEAEKRLERVVGPQALADCLRTTIDRMIDESDRDQVASPGSIEDLESKVYEMERSIDVAFSQGAALRVGIQRALAALEDDGKFAATDAKAILRRALGKER